MRSATRVATMLQGSEVDSEHAIVLSRMYQDLNCRMVLKIHFASDFLYAMLIVKFCSLSFPPSPFPLPPLFSSSLPSFSLRCDVMMRCACAAMCVEVDVDGSNY